jgi:hypothetical protein
MSLRSSEGIRPPTSENAIQKAHNLVAPGATTSITSIKEIWEDLCQLYRADLRSDRTHESFPKWILDQFSDQVIQKLVEAECGEESIWNIKKYAPEWKFVLFLGKLSQRHVKALYDLARNRPNITLDSLYGELCRIQSEQHPLQKGPIHFQPREIRSCSRSKSSDNVSFLESNMS